MSASIDGRERPLREYLFALPGWVAAVLMIAATTLWTFWGIAEMYHEGWWGAWTNRLPYLLPTAFTLVPTLVAFRRPVAGGVLITGIGVFAWSFFGGGVAVIGLAIAVIGLAFLADGLLRRRAFLARHSAGSWWRRRWREVLAVGLPAITAVAISAANLPIVLTRQDDGDRSIRLIAGNDVNLLWAPEGPGWNWQQPWGGYPSWQQLALYSVPRIGLGDKPGYGRQADGSVVFATAGDMVATGLCRYLNEAGTALLDQPQDIWRLPAVDEMVRSLGRHGENAGCSWQGEFAERVSCDVRPDKESPLWATDLPVIYYWAADEYSADEGYFVAYNGTVNAAFKTGGNPRHGYRCVRTP